MVRSFRLMMAAAVAMVVMCWSLPAEPSVPICPLSEIRAGQRAVGKSVFRGTEIESFNLEIIGVLRKYDGTRSVILARVLDGTVVKRQSGVIMGMSGSPVYVNGKLAGAISLGWTFTREPIAGITPIEEMLEAWQEAPSAKPQSVSPGEGQRSGGSAAEVTPATPLMVEGRKISSVRFGPAEQAKADPPGVMTLTPLGGLVQVSGFNQRAVKRLSEALAPYGLRVTQGPAGGEEQMTPPLVPGAAVGAQLVSGDFDVSGLGTVTLVEGDRILAFGHPMMQLGSVDMPLTGGYVYDIMPSLYMSEKVMAPTKAVGVVYRDHQAAIAGRLGQRADLLPVVIEVTDRDLGRTRRFSLGVVRTKELMPILVAICSMTAFDETRGRVTRGTTRVAVEIEVEGRAPLTREEWGYDDEDASFTVLPLVLQPLMVFTDNPLGSLKMKSIRLRVEATEKRQTATIERLRVVNSRVKAGDKVSLTVTVRPHGKPTVDLPMEFSLPSDLPRGQVRVAVTSGGQAEEARVSLGAPRPRPVSLDQLVDRYLAIGKSTELVVQAGLARRGVGMLGEELPDLPGGALNALRATRPTDLRPLATVLKVVKPTEWVLSGRQMVVLQVESPMAPGPAPRIGPPPTEAPEEEPAPEEGEEEPDGFLSGPVHTAVQAFPLAAGEETAGGGEGTEAEKPAKGEKPGEGKPLTKAPDSWVHRFKKDYAKAKLEEVAVREDGRITLALSHHELARVPADVIWCVAVREGVAYVGTGTEGRIYRVSATGEVKEFFATGEMNVHDLEFDSEGNLYAATSPRGKLLRITPDGKGEVVYTADATYLWCLAMAPEGVIYAGSGSPARIHVIETKAQGGAAGRVLAEFPAANVLSLVRAESGDLYAGTANAGVVYRVRPDGAVSTVCNLPASSVEALARDGAGNLYASGSPGGEIYRIPSGGAPSFWCKTEQGTVYGMAAMADGEVIAATGPNGLVMRIGPDAEPEVIFRPETGTATAIAESGGAVYVGISGPSAVHEFGPGPAPSGQLESTPMDAERAARWGRLEWTADVPEGTEVKADTRSGDSPDPNDHWSEWASVTGGVIGSPRARYLQYRLTLTTTDGKTAPEVTTVRVSRQPQNRPPTCAVKSPLPTDRAAKKVTVKWEGKDPDKDSLVYEVEVSSDLGKTWKELKKDLTATQYEWDTAQSSDGQYLVRVKATDARSRPDDPQTVEASSPVVVDNTPPKVMIFRTSVSVTEDKRGQVKGMATDASSPIRSVEYRVDDGSWQSLPLPMIEFSLADFSVTTEPLSGGSHKIEVRAFDAAGNRASDKAEVKVEGAAEVKASEGGEGTKASGVGEATAATAEGAAAEQPTAAGEETEEEPAPETEGETEEGQ